MTGPAIADLKSAFRRLPFVWEFARLELAGRYRRAALGPLWVSATIGVQIALLGMVFSRLLQNGGDNGYFPYLAAGLVLWTFLSTVIVNSVKCFQNFTDFILQGRISYFMLVCMVIAKEALLLAHHLIVFVVVMVIFQLAPTWATLLTPVTFIALLAVLLPWGLLGAMLNARFRDIENLVENMMRAAVFFTPIMWMPSTMSGKWLPLLVQFNPLAAMIGVVRAPMLGQLPSALDVTVLAVFGIVGWVGAIWLMNRYRRRIAYWL